MTMDKTEASFVTEIPTSETVNTVEFFHQNGPGPVLLACAGETFVSICVLHLPQLESDIEAFSYDILADIQHGASVQRLSWSPRTSMLVHPVGMIFCTAAIDHQLRLFKLNNKLEVTKQIIGEHSSFINDCAFDPFGGDRIASVGDDKKLCIWTVGDSDDVSGSVERVPLCSAGVSVRWNPSDPEKLLVAEQAGSIRIYNSQTLQPIMTLLSLNASLGLFSCDWSISNPLLVGAVVGKEWLIWDTSKSTLPETSNQAHMGIAQEFRWSPSNADLFSTRGRPCNQANIYNCSNNSIEFSMSTKLGRGLSWHNMLPLVAIGGDKKLIVHNFNHV